MKIKHLRLIIFALIIVSSQISSASYEPVELKTLCSEAERIAVVSLISVFKQDDRIVSRVRIEHIIKGSNFKSFALVGPYDYFEFNKDYLVFLKESDHADEYLILRGGLGKFSFQQSSRTFTLPNYSREVLLNGSAWKNGLSLNELFSFCEM